jgi:threonine/homoserine/homoserine lactone efflux protein
MSALPIVLPMAFVMVAGPQIVTAILLATGMRPRRDSAFFLLGAGVATFIGVTASYFLTGLLKRSGAPLGGDARVTRAIDVAIIGLLVFLAWKVSRERSSQPPRWMAKLESATPLFALRIGFLLFLLLPGDLISMFTVGAYLAHHGAPWWHGLVFVAATVALAGVPLLLLLALGQRGKALLPRARDWMTKNSWIVSEIVIGFFLLMSLKDLLGG